ncbi:hypothetical protein ES703_02734 [subsurface metagenome]
MLVHVTSLDRMCRVNYDGNAGILCQIEYRLHVNGVAMKMHWNNRPGFGGDLLLDINWINISASFINIREANLCSVVKDHVGG